MRLIAFHYLWGFSSFPAQTILLLKAQQKKGSIEEDRVNSLENEDLNAEPEKPNEPVFKRRD